MRIVRTLTIGLVLLGLSATGTAAQQLELKRELPAIAWSGCPALTAIVDVPDDAARAEAEQLVVAATEASILGDNTTALERLGRAAALDGTSAAIAYRHARTLEELQRTDAAVGEYCRYLGLPGATDSAEARQRLATLTRPEGFVVPRAAATAYEDGLRSYDEGRLEQADTAFGVAADAMPTWSAAIYNRALVRLELGLRQPAIEDLRRYLELSPGAPDFGVVLDRLGALQEAAPRNPAGVLAVGLLLPGLGHFTTGRPAVGALVMGAAGSAIAAGLLIERSEVQCLSPPVDGRCPPGQVLRENVERPFLIPGLIAAAVVGIGGAIHAYRGVRNRNEEALLRVGGQNGRGGAALVRPAVRVGTDGMRVDILRLRF
ncbi:MAG: hypothetical protein ACREKM_11365 [Longimicrobiales bacterium]